MKRTAKQQTENLCEDLGATIHRMVIRLRRAGFINSLDYLSDKSKVPHSRVTAMYYAEAPQATLRQMAAVEWAAEQLLKKGTATG